MEEAEAEGEILKGVGKKFWKWLIRLFGVCYFTLMGLLLQMNWFCAWLSGAKMCRVYINNFGEAWPEFFLTLLCTAFALVGIIIILKDLFNEE